MKRKMFMLAVCALVASCDGASSSYTGSYVGGDNSALIQLELVDSGEGQLNGTMAVSQLDYEAGKLETTIKPITGVQNGGQLSLLAHSNSFGASDSPLSMEAEGNSLLWKVPMNGMTIELVKTDQAAYRERLVAFESQLHGTDAGMIDWDNVD